MGLILNIISSIIKWALLPIAYVFGILNLGYSKYNRDLALANDRYGNVLCSYIFNHLLITEDGYKFGNGKETISSVIGKNKLKNKLTKLGKLIDNILNLLQKNHSINSIDTNV